MIRREIWKNDRLLATVRGTEDELAERTEPVLEELGLDPAEVEMEDRSED